MTTLKDALGPAARPLAGVVAAWKMVPSWRRRAVRIAYPDLARGLDDLAAGVEFLIGPVGPSSYMNGRPQYRHAGPCPLRMETGWGGPIHADPHASGHAWYECPHQSHG